MPHLFHIATVANDLAGYDRMRASMERAGFTQDQCRFSLFDNSKENRFEPYQVLRTLAADGNEPWVVLCHQDLLFDEESSLALLQRQIDWLHQHDPRWAVAGTAGVDYHGRPVLHLDDPTGRYRDAPTARRVLTLDENFLLLRRSNYILPTPGLSGFHFYGADLCLNAWRRKATAYVLPFPVKHLSAGAWTSEAFLRSKNEFEIIWRKWVLMGLIGTTCAQLRVSRFALLRRLLASGRVQHAMKRFGVAMIGRI